MGVADYCYYYYFLPQVVKIPGDKNFKKLISKCRMVIGLAGQLAECGAKALLLLLLFCPPAQSRWQEN